MAQVTIDVEEDVLARARNLAQAQGLSLDEWVQNVIEQNAITDLSSLPRDPFIGMLADEPELADAIDEVVAERHKRRFREP